MLSRDPTYIGEIVSVSGSAVRVSLAQSVGSGVSIISGRAYKIGQVGSFIRVPQGYQDLFGIVSEVGANAVSDDVDQLSDTGRWMNVELVGESTGGTFERGISQYPNIGDFAHLAVEKDLWKIYSAGGRGHVTIGTLSSSESIPARISLNELLTRHSAVLGSTGSGKSTMVAGLIRAITTNDETDDVYPNARIILLDIHGEYSDALADVAQIFSIEPQANERSLYIPYWALDSNELMDLLIGELVENHEIAFTDKIFDLKSISQETNEFPGVELDSITVDTPIPFSLKQLWFDLVDFELKTFTTSDRDEIALQRRGDPDSMTAPVYSPAGMGSSGPFLNQNAVGIRRQLNLLRSRMLDSRYDFLLHPGPWEPDANGTTDEDLDGLLRDWLGGSKPVTILNLSGVPAGVLERLIGSLLKIIYDALFWSRAKSEGGYWRPLLTVMEEAHRYLSDNSNGAASDVIQRIAKEGRKYGVGAMVVSQRPSEVNETVLSQCGTFFNLRLSNPADRSRVQGTLPDGLTGILDALPTLRTGEAIVTGEAAKLPMRCRITLPPERHRPQSQDPNVVANWAIPMREEGYDRVVLSWRAQSPYAVVEDLDIELMPVDDDTMEELGGDRE